MNRLRLTFKCWNCDQTFQLTRDISNNPRALIDCPYCGKRSVYDFNLYRDSKSEVLKDGSEIDMEKVILDLPEVIDTFKPKEEDQP